MDSRIVYNLVCKFQHTRFFMCRNGGVKYMNQLTLIECSKRRLDETYLVIYAIKNEINI